MSEDAGMEEQVTEPMSPARSAESFDLTRGAINPAALTPDSALTHPGQVPPGFANQIPAVRVTDDVTRHMLRDELAIVLMLSIAASAINSLLSLLNSLTQHVSLSDQSATIIGSATPDRPWLDLTYQLVRIVLALVPVALVWHLLRRSGEGLRGIGFDLSRPGWDAIRGVLLAAVIGSSGLVLYLVAYRLGLSVKIAAVTAVAHWWTIPVILLTAAYNAVLEEVIVLGYLIRRLEQLGAKPWVAIASSAVLRGTYHLYQGFGGFVGNLVMGLLFGYLFKRWNRVMPMAFAHFLIDAVGFVGYLYLHGRWAILP